MIKNKREAAGLSQKRLGSACGLSDSEIMKIENGQRKTPSWKNLCKNRTGVRLPSVRDFVAEDTLLSMTSILK